MSKEKHDHSSSSHIHVSWQRRVFEVVNVIFLIAVSILCLLPLVHVLALSFSSPFSAAKGDVGIWPVNFTLASYKYVVNNVRFWKAALVTIERIALGVPLTLLMVFITAYPLSKSEREFKLRKFYTTFFIIPMLFGGGGS